MRSDPSGGDGGPVVLELGAPRCTCLFGDEMTGTPAGEWVCLSCGRVMRLPTRAVSRELPEARPVVLHHLAFVTERELQARTQELYRKLAKGDVELPGPTGVAPPAPPPPHAPAPRTLQEGRAWSRDRVPPGEPRMASVRVVPEGMTFRPLNALAICLGAIALGCALFVVGFGGAALVDTGPAQAVPRVVMKSATTRPYAADPTIGSCWWEPQLDAVLCADVNGVRPGAVLRSSAGVPYWGPASR